jgi:hypothetical protein
MKGEPAAQRVIEIVHLARAEQTIISRLALQAPAAGKPVRRDRKSRPISGCGGRRKNPERQDRPAMAALDGALTKTRMMPLRGFVVCRARGDLEVDVLDAHIAEFPDFVELSNPEPLGAQAWPCSPDERSCSI